MQNVKLFFALSTYPAYLSSNKSQQGFESRRQWLAKRQNIMKFFHLRSVINIQIFDP